MTQLSRDFDTKLKAGTRHAIGGPFPVAASQLLYMGALVGLNAAGRLAEVTAANGLHVAGVARRRYDNASGGEGAINGELDYGVHRFTNAGSPNALVQADVGKPVFIYDDNTVGKFSATAGGCVGLLENLVGSYAYVDVQSVDWANRSFGHDYLSEEVEDAAATVAVGITRYTIDGTDSSALPAGRYIGQRKRLMSIAGANTPVLTVTPVAVEGFAAIILGAAGDFADVRWSGAAWSLLRIGGAASVTWS